VPLGGPPQALAQMLAAEQAKWAPVVRALNLKVDQ